MRSRPARGDDAARPEIPAGDHANADVDLFKSLVTYSSDILTVISLDGYVRYQSLAAASLLGRDPTASMGERVEALVHDDDKGVLLGLLEPGRLSAGATIALELRLVRGDGSCALTETTITNQLANPGVRGFVLASRDISERKDLEEQLRFRANYDTLTGLGNRALFRDRLEHGVARARRYKTGLALLFIDLDGFKLVNDTLGHDAGDHLLVEVARRITSTLRSSDTVARMGGDEFAIILEEPDDVRSAPAVAGRILASFQTPLLVDGVAIRISGSIGLDSTGGANASSAEEMLRNADLAMYRAKGQGKNQIALYEPGMRDSALNRVRLEKELRRAIDNDELVLHYQPVVSLTTGRVTGLEALVRWNHPERGMVPPSDFVPIAEESGLIVELGRWALMRACHAANVLSQHTSRDDFWVSVNVATRQLLQPGLIQSVRAALRQSGLPAERLMLEITEGALLNDPRTCASLLHQLRVLGAGLAIDDFGTGYSSLSRLRTFPVDKLKIDRSFIQEISGANDRVPIVAAVMAMAHSLGLSAVAEGVETTDQLRCLVAQGCEEVQGYLLSRPAPLGELVELVGGPDNVLTGLGLGPRRASHDSPLTALVRELADEDGADVTRRLLAELTRQLGAAGAFLVERSVTDPRAEVVLVSSGGRCNVPEGMTVAMGAPGTFRAVAGPDVPPELAARGVKALTAVPVVREDGDARLSLAVAGSTASTLSSEHIVLVELLTRLLAERLPAVNKAS